jgi:hypothetical protein
VHVGGMSHIIEKNYNEGYNFISNLISIKGLYKKLWPFKMPKNQISRILKLSTWESRDKMTFECSPVTNHIKYYKEEGGAFPQV